MYKDLISYSLAQWVTHEQLATIADKVWTDWMSGQEWCVGREINTDNDGGYTDIVYWMSKDAADKAQEAMWNNPHAEAWYACYDMSSISSKGLTAQTTFKPDQHC